jgi:hypothetical protein
VRLVLVAVAMLVLHAPAIASDNQNDCLLNALKTMEQNKSEIAAAVSLCNENNFDCGIIERYGVAAVPAIMEKFKIESLPENAGEYLFVEYRKFIVENFKGKIISKAIETMPPEKSCLTGERRNFKFEKVFKDDDPNSPEDNKLTIGDFFDSLRSTYKMEGFYFAQITPELEPPKPFAMDNACAYEVIQKFLLGLDNEYMAIEFDNIVIFTHVFKIPYYLYYLNVYIDKKQFPEDGVFTCSFRNAISLVIIDLIRRNAGFSNNLPRDGERGYINMSASMNTIDAMRLLLACVEKDFTIKGANFELRDLDKRKVIALLLKIDPNIRKLVERWREIAAQKK